eukprot:6183166-Pleurochrysis_carterae.AAC.4
MAENAGPFVRSTRRCTRAGSSIACWLHTNKGSTPFKCKGIAKALLSRWTARYALMERARMDVCRFCEAAPCVMWDAPVTRRA